MKRTLLLLPLIVATVFGQPLTPDSTLREVTVYLDRAVLTRTATVDLRQTGIVEIAFEKLPAQLVEGSLQASGQGEAAATLLDVSTRATYLEAAANPRVNALEQQLRDLAHQERTLADRATLLNQQRDYVLRIQTATTQPPKEGTPITSLEVWTRMLAFSEEQLAKFAAEQRTLDAEREELKARRDALERELSDLRSASGRSYQTAVVRLDVASPGTLDLTVRYAVFGASWTPTYDVRARSTERTVEIGYAGLVRQSTGEDWSQVALTLSTARPSLGGAAPELSPWIVQQRPTEADAVILSGFGAESTRDRTPRALAAAPAARQEKLSRPVAVATARVESQATSATFRIAAPATIPADNAPHKVPVSKISLQADSTYQSTPKLLAAAFLTASVTNSSEFPLLAGRAQVFLDDMFVASTDFRSVMPGEKFDLALGADDGVSVKRKLSNRFVEDTGLVSRGRRVTYDITLTVQNNKSVPVKLTLQDQLPVSRHEKIVVKTLAPSERELKPDADGVLKWQLDLKPGEKRELPLKFSVEHPNDLPVSGLE